MIWLVAGINGAGKSTISTTPSLLDFMGVSAVINPDQMARDIAVEQKISYELANLSAAIISQAMVFNEAVYSTIPAIAIETVLSTKKYDPILDIASQRKFPVGMIYVSVRSVELTLKHIETRVAAGLHNVPEDVVRKRWPLTMANMASWASRVDQLIVFANNSSVGQLVRVAQKTSKDRHIEILDRSELPELVEILLSNCSCKDLTRN
jgi:predicted ABC-type ATPase